MELREQLQQSIGNDYVFERELKSGGMSRIFLAEEVGLGRKVVVKVLSGDVGAVLSPERFAKEVRLAASLQHPNIAPILRAGTAGDLPYYTMPYISGESVRSRVDHSGLLTPAKAISILHDVACALEFAHAAGIVHRDIKPENVLLAGDAAVVIDFGIAKALSASRTDTSDSSLHGGGRGTLTIAGTLVGTPAYMSPEQISGDSVDARTDIYAWGLLAYELLGGGHPFRDRNSAQQLMVAHVTESPPPLAQRVPTLPSPIVALVMRCLQKNPDDRPQSAREVLDALSGASPLAKSTFARRRMQIIGGALLAGLMLVAVAGRHRLASAFGAQAPASARTQSLAVLPFFNVGGDTANAYFAEGMADELTSQLTKVPGLRVASRTSAFAMRMNRGLDVREIGKQLGVSAVLEGTVRRSNGRLRVTTQLTSAEDGLTLWSDTYERDSRDIFAVQDQITKAIISALGPTLSARRTQGGSPPATGSGTNSVDAYDLYLRGRYLLERRGKGVSQAAAYFSQAIAKDSGFARAYAGLSEALELFPYFAATPAREVEGRATAAANHALALDSGLAEPHAALALAYMHAFRWPAAEQEFHLALAADSTSATAHTQYGRYLMATGQILPARDQFRIARTLDPLAGTPSVWLSLMLSLSGDYAGSEQEAKRAWELDSTLSTAHNVLALDRLHLGELAEARAAIGSADESGPFSGVSAFVLASIGDTARAAVIRRRLDGLPADTWMLNTAHAFAYLGIPDTSRALAALEAAVRAREITPNWQPLAGRMYDGVRSSPRFARVVDGFGLSGRGLTSPFAGRPAR
ncbi:MAG TPA: protein kinase [Gemmatimonadaceae bacterium]|nr:protein kinase [Gemmatimonadaceae bacterium]